MENAFIKIIELLFFCFLTLLFHVLDFLNVIQLHINISLKKHMGSKELHVNQFFHKYVITEF